MYKFKITSIETNDGTTIEPKKINIIVGPNSSGKSRFLKDLKFLMGGNDYSSQMENIVIKNINYDTPKDVDEFIEKYNIEERIKVESGNSYIKNYFGVNLSYMDANTSISNYLDNTDVTLGLDWKKEIQDDINHFYNGNNFIENFGLDLPANASDIHVEDKIVVSYKIDDENKTIETTQGESYFENNESSIKENYKIFLSKYGKLFFQYLGTEEKLLMCKRQRRYGDESNNLNLLSELQFHLDDVRKLSNITKELFGKYIYLDRYTYGDSLAFRVSEDFDFYKEIKQDNSKSEKKIREYPLLDDEGDGIKNFVSTYLAIKSMNKDVFLLDEPESFLHPPLARRFGEIISKEISDDQQIFIVTHSEDIINGIVSTMPYTKFNIIRVERDKDINNLYVMASNYRSKLRTKTVVMMSNILKGFFSEKVYVTESFADSALYQSLMTKYNNFSSFYFVNTEGKDKIGDVLELYDCLNVKAVGIYDFDFFRNRETIKSSLNKKLGNGPAYDALNNVLKEAREYLQKKAKNEASSSKAFSEKTKEEQKSAINTIKDRYYHKEGISSIDDEILKAKLIDTIEKMKQYGIYVLKTGCLETTLETLGIAFSKDKSKWIDSALEFVDKLDATQLEKVEILDLISGKV